MASYAREPRAYELMAILLPDLAEEDLTGAIDRVSGYITDVTGAIKETLTDSPWGRRRLAYPIRFNSQDYRDGYYVIWHFDVEPSRMTEIERELKLDVRVIRYLVVHADPKWGSPNEGNQPPPGDPEPGERRPFRDGERRPAPMGERRPPRDQATRPVAVPVAAEAGVADAQAGSTSTATETLADDSAVAQTTVAPETDAAATEDAVTTEESVATTEDAVASTEESVGTGDEVDASNDDSVATTDEAVTIDEEVVSESEPETDVQHDESADLVEAANGSPAEDAVAEEPVATDNESRSEPEPDEEK